MREMAAVGRMEESARETDRALESVQPAGGGAVVADIPGGGVFGLGRINQELLPNIKLPVVGHGKGLPLNRRGGELYGEDAITDDALISQERRTAFWVDELRGFTQGEPEHPRDLLFRGGRGSLQ
jgi:hypothetical protein